MQELDVSKPIMFRDKPDVIELKYLCEYLDNQKSRTFAFLATFIDGRQELYNRYPNGMSELDIEYKDDIINVPEETEFSWDKPARNIFTKNRAVNTKEEYGFFCVLYQFEDLERIWSRYDDKETAAKHLENYEPEEKYEIELLTSGNLRAILAGECVYSVYLENARRKVYYGFTSRKEDAEAFKKLKEQGL